jgi:hypothetical protein
MEVPMKPHYFRSFSLVLVTALSTSVQADEPTTLAAARAEFLRGRAGDGAAVERANHMLEQLAAAHSGDPLVLAYYGASFALLGRDAWAPWSKAKYTEKGLAILDKAVAMITPELDRTPAGIETRLVASATFLVVPGMFHHFEAGKACVREALASPAFAAAPAEVRADLLMQSAAVARKEERAADEADALERAIAAAPEAPVVAPARRRLAEVGR